jgi:hypothetical protein
MCFQVRYPLIFRSKPIQIISIPLHHLSAFFQIFSVVISTPYSVPFLMSQLLFYNVISEFILIQFSFIAYTIVWFFLLWVSLGDLVWLVNDHGQANYTFVINPPLSKSQRYR